MSIRDSAPNAAFAYVGEINGMNFKLLRHHDIDKVKDGNEHDSVNPQLLIACINMAKNNLQTIPLNDESRKQVLDHLLTHASAMKLEINEDSAKKIINQQSGGDAPEFDEVNETEGDLPSNRQDITPKNADISGAPDLPTSPKNTPRVNRENVTNASSDKVTADEAGTYVKPQQNQKENKDKKRVRQPEGSPRRRRMRIQRGAILKKRNTHEFVCVLETSTPPLKVIDKDEKKFEISEENLKNWEVLHKDLILEEDKEIKENSTKADFSKIQQLTDPVLSEDEKIFCSFSRIQNVDKAGSIEFLAVQLGEDDFPFTIMLDVGRGSDNSVKFVKILNEVIPAEAISDLGMFLRRLMREQS